MNKQNQQQARSVTTKNGDQGGGTPIQVPMTNYQLPTEGTHDAICIRVIDAGTQFHKKYGKRRVLIITVELTDETAIFHEEKGEEPFTLSAYFTLTLGEKSKLHETIVAWKGRHAVESLRFDLGRLLGSPCTVNVIHEEDEKGQLKAKILKPILPPGRGVKFPAPVNPLLSYAISDGMGGSFDQQVEWVQKMICASEEIGGARPSVEEIAERNVREATANAHHVEPKPHRPIGISEPTSADDIDEDAINAKLAAAATTANGGEEYPF
jgi:hypothetical protein